MMVNDGASLICRGCRVQSDLKLRLAHCEQLEAKLREETNKVELLQADLA